MDVIEAIKTRKSIRAFKPDPVPKEVLTKLMQTCVNAPSWANSQPWEFAIISGAAMEEIRRRLAERVGSGARPNTDIPWPSFPEPYISRIRDNGRTLFEVLGIAREDRQRRLEWSQEGARFFGAPNGIILYIDRDLPTYSILDAGMMLQTIMLAALGYGLGTCAEVAVVTHPDILREVLGIPPSKLIVLGVAIGYPDMNAIPNTHHSGREPLETFVTWHGFD